MGKRRQENQQDGVVAEEVLRSSGTDNRTRSRKAPGEAAADSGTRSSGNDFHDRLPITDTPHRSETDFPPSLRRSNNEISRARHQKATQLIPTPQRSDRCRLRLDQECSSACSVTFRT